MVSLTQKIFVNFDNFLYDFWSPNCVDTSRTKFVDILRLKFVYSSSKYIYIYLLIYILWISVYFDTEIIYKSVI